MITEEERVIIGPIEEKDWRTMSLLEGSKLYYLSHNSNGKYTTALLKEKELLKKYLKKYTKGGVGNEEVASSVLSAA